MNKMLELAKALSSIDAETSDLPFEEVEMTKEQCYEMCRNTYTLLEHAGCRPYTLFNFREESNNIARRHVPAKYRYYGTLKNIPLSSFQLLRTEDRSFQLQWWKGLLQVQTSCYS